MQVSQELFDLAVANRLSSTVSFLRNNSVPPASGGCDKDGVPDEFWTMWGAGPGHNG